MALALLEAPLPLRERTHGTMNDATLRTALRGATSALHSDLDSALGRSLRNVDDYVAFLKGSRRALAALDADSLSEVLPPSALGTQRIPRIDGDLVALGHRARTDATPQGNVAKRPVAAYWGTAYVVEGSSLGGVVLADRLEAALSLDGRATTYLRGTGRETAGRWRTFLAALESWASGASAIDHETAIRAARDAFTAFRDAFAGEGLVAAR